MESAYQAVWCVTKVWTTDEFAAHFVTFFAIAWHYKHMYDLVVYCDIYDLLHLLKVSYMTVFQQLFVRNVWLVGDGWSW